MKSNVIRVDNHGHGLEELKREVGKVAVYEEIGERDTLDLQLLAEELFSLLRISQLHKSGIYDRIIVDCAPTGETLSLLKFPELLSWYMEKLFPIG